MAPPAPRRAVRRRARRRNRRRAGRPAARGAGRRPGGPGRGSAGRHRGGGARRRPASVRASARSCSAPTCAALLDTGPTSWSSCMGGIEPARELILSALKRGASVVTANKALDRDVTGRTLHAAAGEAGVDLFYEAAVAGAIPLLRPAARVAGRGPDPPRAGHRQRHHQLHPDPDGRDRRLVRRRAGRRRRRLGYAEADPTADVDGLDAAAKAAILASIAFHTRVTLDDVAGRGHHRDPSADVAAARRDGLRHQAAGRRRAHRVRSRGRGQRAGPPDAGAGIPPAGRRARRVQRRLHRGRRRRSGHVLRPRGRWRADRQRRARRHRDRRPQPGHGLHRAGRVLLRRSARSCRIGSHDHHLLRAPAGRRPARRAGRGGRRVRRARGRASAASTRGAAGERAELLLLTHPASSPTWPPLSRSCASCHRSTRCWASCA